MREIRMLRAMRRELETDPRRVLIGHEGGNPGRSQGSSYGPPRQFPTLPGLPDAWGSLICQGRPGQVYLSGRIESRRAERRTPS